MYDLLYYNSESGSYADGAGTYTGFDYWVAGKMVQNSNYMGPIYRVAMIEATFLQPWALEDATGWGSGYVAPLRCVVSLTSDVELEETSEGSGEWEIVGGTAEQ